MICFLAQIILAAQNEDSDKGGWMQLLVFLILALFYALNDIIKAKQNKTAKQADHEMKRKADLEQPTGTQTHRPLKLLRQQQTQPGSLVLPKQTFPPKLHSGGRRVHKLSPKPVLESKSIKAPYPYPQTVDKVKPPSVIGLSFDFHDPDKLRSAILHYEIFGTPVSLREPIQHLPTF